MSISLYAETWECFKMNKLSNTYIVNIVICGLPLSDQCFDNYLHFDAFNSNNNAYIMKSDQECHNVQQTKKI